MVETQDKRPDNLNKEEAADNKEPSNPFLDEIARVTKFEPWSQKLQDFFKSSTEQSNLPSFEITSEKTNSGRDSDKTKDSAKTQDRLASVKFGPDKVIEAFAAAQERNIPVIVNRNMDDCAPSQRSNKELDSYIKRFGGTDKPPAVIIDLNFGKLNSMRQEHASMLDGPNKDRLTEELKVANKLMNSGHSIFPEISKYDANDSSKPVANIIGSDVQNIERLFATKKESAESGKSSADKSTGDLDSKADSSPESSMKPKENKVLKFSDKDMAEAVEYAKSHNLPLVVFTGAEFCASSKMASPEIDKLANSFALSADPRAVIVKLDLGHSSSSVQSKSSAEKESVGTEDESRELASRMKQRVREVPHIAVFNPNNLDKPFGTSTVNPHAGVETLVWQLSLAAKEAMQKR